jgi:hypothetical protein
MKWRRFDFFKGKKKRKKEKEKERSNISFLLKQRRFVTIMMLNQDSAYLTLRDNFKVFNMEVNPALSTFSLSSNGQTNWLPLPNKWKMMISSPSL